MAKIIDIRRLRRKHESDIYTNVLNKLKAMMPSHSIIDEGPPEVKILTFETEADMLRFKETFKPDKETLFVVKQKRTEGRIVTHERFRRRKKTTE